MDALRFFNPYAEIRQTENRLPHWRQEAATYFITFRLNDAVPAKLRYQWEDERAAWLRVHAEPWSAEVERAYHQRFSGAIEDWLDAGHGSCLLRRLDCRTVVSEALHHFDGERIALISFVVMPNHVHAILVQNPEWPLEKVLYSWKTFSARKINALLERRGSFWQRSYFDRLIRDEKHFGNCIRYIRRNPERAHLRETEYLLYESDLAKGVE
jgi:putative transposase